VIVSAGEVLVANINFEDGQVWNIQNEGYELNESQNRDCWVEGEEIYLDENMVRRLRRMRQRRVVNVRPNQQQPVPQQRNEMSDHDCIDKQTVLHKTRLPKDTREALANSDNAFDNFSLKLNKVARFDCRVKIEEYKGRLCKPHLTDDLHDVVRYEDEEGRNIGTAGNPKYLSIHRPLANHERNAWLALNPELPGNADEDGKRIAKKKRGAIKRLFDQSKYAERKFRFCETDKDGFLYQPSSCFGNLDFTKIADRHSRGIEALNLSVSHCEGTIDWRLIVGLGNESVYDTSMTLHHVYGIPYIPASVVKGVVRSWIIIEKFDQIEEKAIQDKGFCDVFGCPKKIKHTPSYYDEERQGKVWFFDAYPLSKPEIEVDIMNPHYGDYYNLTNPKPPADYLSPNPISFLTVGEGAKFQFLIGIKGKDNESIGDNSKLFTDSSGSPIMVRKEEDASELVPASSETPLLYILEAWLSKALEEHGVGAKTAVGYGYMKDFQIGGES